MSGRHPDVRAVVGGDVDAASGVAAGPGGASFSSWTGGRMRYKEIDSLTWNIDGGAATDFGFGSYGRYVSEHWVADV
jgi:hypothetical protein